MNALIDKIKSILQKTKFKIIIFRSTITLSISILNEIR